MTEYVYEDQENEATSLQVEKFQIGRSPADTVSDYVSIFCQESLSLVFKL